MIIISGSGRIYCDDVYVLVKKETCVVVCEIAVFWVRDVNTLRVSRRRESEMFATAVILKLTEVFLFALLVVFSSH